MSAAHTLIPAALKDIWLSNGLPEEFLSHLKFVGKPDQVAQSSFRVGLAAQISIGLSGLSAAYLHFLRTGIEQDVTVDARHAALSFHSEAWYSVNGALPSGELWDNIAGLYQTKDGGWVRIHTNFPHHRSGVLSILSIPDSSDRPATKSEVTQAILRWNGQALEDECAKIGMCVFRLRTPDEWDATDQAKAISNIPAVEIRDVGEGKKLELGKTIGSKRPLESVRVLDLSRVLAGPVAGRALAAHGAEVLLITSPKLPSLPYLDTETSLGKRTTQLDLNLRADHENLTHLVRGTDVLLQAYRPGGIAGHGFGVDDVLKTKATEENKNAGRDGVVYASLRAWGWGGPWADRRGFDSLVQTATGFNLDEANAYRAYLKSQGKPEGEWTPKPFPMQALDHAAGYLLAFGINVALARMIKGGRSHEVRVSLAGVGRWVRSLGRLPPEEAFGSDALSFPAKSWPQDDEIIKLSTAWAERVGKDTSNNSAHGRKMTALRHAAILSATPVREGILGDARSQDDWGAPMRLDADDATWSHPNEGISDRR